jgi:hypothetical protein
MINSLSPTKPLKDTEKKAKKIGILISGKKIIHLFYNTSIQAVTEIRTLILTSNRTRHDKKIFYVHLISKK